MPHVPAAGFLYGYLPAPPPLVRRGIYAQIRHPLFLGGVIASCGAALLFTPVPLLLAAVNLLALPLYGRLEDARLTRVFGGQHEAYSLTVGRFLPRLWARPAEAKRFPGWRRAGDRAPARKLSLAFSQGA